MIELDEFYFNKKHNSYASQCKPCHNETARESAERNKYNHRVREQIRYARENGDMSSVQCKKCKKYMPETTFKPHDTRVFINGELILDGYTEICGYCYTVIKDKVLSQIPGAIKYANEKQLKRRTKTDHIKVS